MEKGHANLRELLLLVIFVTAAATAMFVLTGGSEAMIMSKSDASSMQSMAANASGVEVTHSAIGALLDAGTSRANSRYYSNLSSGTSGRLTIHTYRWAVGNLTFTLDAVPVKKNDLRASEVRFDGRYEDSLRGFVFSTYEMPSLTYLPTIYATAIFLSNSTPLDAYYQNSSAVTISYDPHPSGTQILDRCSVLSVFNYVTPSGNPIKIYDLKCRTMYEAY